MHLSYRRSFLVSLIFLSVGMPHPKGNKPSRPSLAWTWPDRGRGKQSSSLKFPPNSGSIESRAIFTFGTFAAFPITYQTRVVGSPPKSFNILSGGSGPCVCVPFYLCEEAQVTSSDGAGVIDVRQGWQCRSVSEVCCRNPRTTTIPPVNTPPPTSSPSNEGSGGDFESTTLGSIIPAYEPQCGTMNPNGVHARILGFKDSETQFGEFPWQAAILEQKLLAGQWVLKFICGASLIWPSVAITSAHCVSGRRAEHLLVRLGEWDTQSESEFLPHQDIWGSEIVVHPLYYAGSLLNDIALIFLRHSAIISPHISPICLPAQSPLVSYDESSCWATGWGRNSHGPEGQFQSILHKVELPIVREDVCASILRNTSLGPQFNFHSSYLCAGGLRGRDTCIGDGGGPLVCQSLIDPWRFVLAGITSWGLGCGTYGIPGVYVDVADFTSWIEAQVSLRVPAFDPRKVDVDSSGGKYGHGNTVTPQPQQYI